jgi:methyl coenzyme M reductase subunit C
MDSAASAPAELQQLKLRRIAVVHLITIFAHQVDGADITLQHRNAHFIRHQQATNHLSEATKAHDDHLRFIIFHPRRFVFIVCGIQAARQQFVHQLHQQLGWSSSTA